MEDAKRQVQRMQPRAVCHHQDGEWEAKGVPSLQLHSSQTWHPEELTSVDEVAPSFNHRVTGVLVSQVPGLMGLHRELLLAQELGSFQIPTYKISSLPLG